MDKIERDSYPEDPLLSNIYEKLMGRVLMPEEIEALKRYIEEHRYHLEVENIKDTLERIDEEEGAAILSEKREILGQQTGIVWTPDLGLLFLIEEPSSTK